MKEKRKIIGVGFHKTGLSTLKLALEVLGFRTIKGQQAYLHKMTANQAVEKLEQNSYEELLESIVDYDATVDNPWNILFDEIDRKFPNCKFIFTIREEQRWLKSAKKYFLHRPDTPIRKWIYGCSAEYVTDELYLERYRVHNNLVMEYFKDRPADFLVLNIEEGDGWEKICRFLNKPIVKLPFPQQNKNFVES